MKKGITVLMIVLCMACLTFSLLACDGNGDTTPNLPDGDTVVISGEYQPPIDHDNDYDDEDVDYSQAVVIEGTTLTELTEYGKTLKRIVIPEGVTNIGSYSFVFCTSLTSVVIPSSVTSIGDFAFRDCSSLTSIVLPSSVTSIGNGAFCDCRSLISIEIPSGVTSIGSQAFQRCSSLTSIEIPSSVTSICENVFRDCSSLTIYCEAESQPSGWDSRWNSSNRPVVWSYKTENR